MKYVTKNGDTYTIYSDGMFQLKDPENPSRFHIGHVSSDLEQTKKFLDSHQNAS